CCIHSFQHGVETTEPILCLLPVAFDPLGHQVEDLGLQVAWPALGVPATADDTGVLEHFDVLGHRLHADVVRFGQLVDRGVACGQLGDDATSSGVGQGREHSREPVFGHGHTSYATNWLN